MSRPHIFKQGQPLRPKPTADAHAAELEEAGYRQQENITRTQEQSHRMSTVENCRTGVNTDIYIDLYIDLYVHHLADAFIQERRNNSVTVSEEIRWE